MSRKKKEYAGTTCNGWVALARVTDERGRDGVRASKTVDGVLHENFFTLSAWASGNLASEPGNLRAHRHYTLVYLDSFTAENISMASSVDPVAKLDAERPYILYRRIGGKLTLLHKSFESVADATAMMGLGRLLVRTNDGLVNEAGLEQIEEDANPTTLQFMLAVLGENAHTPIKDLFSWMQGKKADLPEPTQPQPEQPQPEQLQPEQPPETEPQDDPDKPFLTPARKAVAQSAPELDTPLPDDSWDNYTRSANNQTIDWHADGSATWKHDGSIYRLPLDQRPPADPSKLIL